MYIGVELGGQSTRILVAECETSFENFTPFYEKTITTSTGKQTLNDIIEALESFFISSLIKTDYICLGIASFGPVDINPSSPKYGFILDTPKPEWSQTDIVTPLSNSLKNHCKELIVQLESDVSAPAKMWAYLLDKKASYITIGTGIGVGFSNPKDLNCEIGHFVVTAHQNDKNYETCCPFHKKHLCVEGAACAVALAKKLDCEIGRIQDFVTKEILESEAFYIAQLCYNATLITEIDTIILGGGVSKMEGLIEKVQQQVDEMNGKYRSKVEIRGDEGLNGYPSGIASAIYIAKSLADLG